MKIIQNYIHSNHENSSKETQAVYDPSTGEKISQVVMSDKNDFDNAIESSPRKI